MLLIVIQNIFLSNFNIILFINKMVNLDTFNCNNSDFDNVMKQMKDQCNIYDEYVLKSVLPTQKYASYPLIFIGILIVLIFLFFIVKYFMKK